MEKIFNRTWVGKKGFSLIELIIAIAIIVVIASVAVPYFIGNIRRANESTDASNAKMIHDAIIVAIELDPDLEGVIIDTNIPFERTAGGGSGQELIIDRALGEFPGGAPMLKASTNTTVDKKFRVTISTSAVVIWDSSGAIQLHPEQ